VVATDNKRRADEEKIRKAQAAADIKIHEDEEREDKKRKKSAP